MQHRTLAGLNRTVSTLGAGCWTIGGTATNRGVPIGWSGVDPHTAKIALRDAYQLGVTLFDTADVYGMGHSERLLGGLIRTVDRSEIIVSSKVGYHAGEAAHPYAPEQIHRQFAATLRNLGTDYLDIYFLHSGDFGADDRRLEPALATLRTLREQGRIRAVGMRAPHEFAEQWAGTHHPQATTAARFLELFGRIQPDVLTVRHNLLSPPYAPGETDIFAFARQHGTGVLIKQALGQGILTGRYEQRQHPAFPPGDHRTTDPMFRPETLSVTHQILERLGALYGRRLQDRLRLALRYALAADPDAVVLVGFRDSAQISASVAAIGEPLSPATITEIQTAVVTGINEHHAGTTSATPRSTT
jgi:aryl-alcohol dehydrogenase-like predicted oxidoreductase